MNAISTATKTTLSLVNDFTAFKQLDPPVQKDIIMKLDGIAPLLKEIPRGKKGELVSIAAKKLNVSEAQIYNYIKAFNKKNFRGLINRQKNPSYSGNLPPKFKSHVKGLFDAHQRNDDGAEVYKKVMDDLNAWRATGDPKYALPGFNSPPPNDPRYDHPKGMSERNILRLRPNQMQRTSTKRGELEANKHLPPVLTTRVGSAYLSRILTDDQYYDNLINDGTLALAGIKDTQRPVSFNALDFYTAYHLKHHMRLEYKESDKVIEGKRIKGKKKSLTSAEYQWFIISLLQEEGYRTDALGTEILGEWKTAAGWQSKSLTTINGCHSLNDALYLVTDGQVRFRKSGLVNKPLFAGLYFKPRSSGNFKFKTWIETSFRLLRTYMQAMPAQIGSNERMNGNAELYGIKQRANQLAVAIADKLDPYSASLIQQEMLDFPKFFQLVNAVYLAVNSRDDHKMEGWKQCMFTEELWRPSEDSKIWYTEAELAQITDPIDKKMLKKRLNENRDTLTRVRNFSPEQAREFSLQHDRKNITKLKDHEVGLLLPWEWAKPVTIGQGYSFHLKNPLWEDTHDTYVAQGEDIRGITTTLDQGMKIKVFANAFGDGRAHLYTLDQKYITTIHPTVRAEPFNPEKAEEQLKVRARIKSVMTADQVARMADIATHRTEREAHNDRILAGDTRTDAERKSDRYKDASLKAGATRRANELSDEDAQDTFSHIATPLHDEYVEEDDSEEISLSDLT